jgi:hypothetical protein
VLLHATVLLGACGNGSTTGSGGSGGGGSCIQVMQKCDPNGTVCCDGPCQNGVCQQDGTTTGGGTGGGDGGPG